MSQSSLEHFVTQVRAALDRGLKVTAEDVLDGLEFAISDKRDKEPVPFDHGVNWIEDRLRQRQLARRTKRQVAEAAQQLDIDYTYRGPHPTPGAPRITEADRRFGQPHYGHRDDDDT